MLRTRHLLGSAVLSVIALAIIAAPVGAGRNWCRADPIVRLDGTEYQLIVAIPEENVSQVDGALDFDIYSPEGTERELLFVDSGFNGHGEVVEFKDHRSSGTHVVVLDVPETGRNFLVQVEVYVDGELIRTATGTSDEVTIPVVIT